MKGKTKKHFIFPFGSRRRENIRKSKASSLGSPHLMNQGAMKRTDSHALLGLDAETVPVVDIYLFIYFATSAINFYYTANCC
jgi:hypothetical protein